MKIVPIHNRITQLVSIPSTLLIIAMATWFTIFQIKTLHAHFYMNSISSAQHLILDLEKNSQFTTERLENTARNLMNYDHVSGIEITQPEQESIFFGKNIHSVEKERTQLSKHLNIKANEQVLQAHIQFNNQLSIVIDFNKAHLRIEILNLMLTNIIILVVALALLYWFTNMMSNRVTRPIFYMLNAIKDLKEGKLDTRIKEINATGEFHELQLGINQMAAALQSAHEDMQSNIDQATQDLRESVETLEIRNIEIDYAYRSAIEGSRVKTEFLANMSHEIRTPLNGIIGFARLLEKNIKDPEQLEYLNTITSSSDSLLNIINDVLDFSKIEAGHVTLDINQWRVRDIVDEVVNLMTPHTRHKNLSLSAIIYEDVPNIILTDSLRLRQILTNLVNNAVKFTAAGNVIIRVALEDSYTDRFKLRFSVEDSGIGISSDQQKNLFKAFTQGDSSTARKFGGTGLGLVISRRLTEHMGGDIGIESEIGNGSTFWFTISCDNIVNIDRSLFVPSLSYETLHIFEPHLFQNAALKSITREFDCQLFDYDHYHDLCQLKDIKQHSFIISLDEISDEDDFIQHCNTLQQRQPKRLIGLTNSETQQQHWQEKKLFDHVILQPLSSKKLLNILNSDSVLVATPTDVEQPLHILAVDDNPANLKLVSIFLEDLNCTVTKATDGLQAVQFGNTQKFDLIFMDIQMPNMDGLTASLKIRQSSLNRTTPIIALTAHAMADEKAKILSQGLDGYLTKPVSSEQISQTISRWYAGHPLIKADDILPISQPIEPLATAKTSTKLDCPELPIEDVNFDLSEALLRANQKKDLAKEMMSMLIEDLPETAATLGTYCASQNYVGLAERVHKLHGATRYCGFIDLQKSCANTETLLKKNKFDDARMACQQLCAQLNQIERWAQQTAWQDFFS